MNQDNRNLTIRVQWIDRSRLGGMQKYRQLLTRTVICRLSASSSRKILVEQ
ncbi:MAG: hypothetical protein WA919_27785 [Coleofasciculaceae cyanobacterium]